MTLTAALSGGDTFNSLTQLNQRLIAQVNEAGIDESTPGDGFIVTDDGVGGRPPDPADDTDTTSKVPTYKSWASGDKLGFETVVNWISETVDMPTGSSSLVDAFLEDWAIKWRDASGLSPTQDPTRVPTANDLLNDEEFQAGLAWLPFRAALATLPPTWLTEVSSVNEETGEEEIVPAIVVNDPLTGVQFIEEKIIPQLDLSNNGQPKSLQSKVRAAISQIVRQGPRSTSLNIQDQLAQNPTTPGYISEFAAMRTRIERSVAHINDDDTPVAISKQGIIPHISEEEFTSTLQSVVPQSSGGGGGGGTKRSIEFDRNNLLAQVEEKWHSWMLEPGDAPKGVIAGIVDNYIREAKAFWSGKGGQLDFDTYVTEKLRATPRYKTVFRHKLPGTTEAQFLNEYLGRIQQFGQGDGFNQQQGFAAVTSGGSPIEQVKRVSRTREVENSGGFSQKLAQTIKGLGL